MLGLIAVVAAMLVQVLVLEMSGAAVSDLFKEGVAAFERRDFAASLVAFESALNAHPSLAPAWARRAAVHQHLFRAGEESSRRHHLAKSIECWGRAHALAPAGPAASEARARRLGLSAEKARLESRWYLRPRCSSARSWPLARTKPATGWPKLQCRKGGLGPCA